MSGGAPDGSTEPSVVVEHRQCLTIMPSAGGNITLAIVPSPYGGIAVDEGVFTPTVNSVDTTGAAPFSYGPIRTVSANLVSLPYGSATVVNTHYSLIPFTESLSTPGTPIEDATLSGLRATQFRVLTTMAKISYTGNYFNNGGVAATGRVSFNLDNDGPALATYGATPDTQFQQVGSQIGNSLPPNMNAVCGLPDARSFPITQSVGITIPFQNLDYQRTRQAWSPFVSFNRPATTKDIIFGGLLDVTATTASGQFGFDPIPGIGYGAVVFYAATGMDTALPQSITIEVRTCVEYTLEFSSPMARFAMLPGPERPLSISRVKAMARDLPSSYPSTPGTEMHGWLYNAAAWYGNTMRSIVGNVWGLAGRAASLALPGIMGRMAGMGIEDVGRAVLPGNARLAIDY